MRIYGPSGTRSGAFDRNPVTIVAGLNTTVGPATSTTFATYTAPANRRATLVVSVTATVNIVLVAGMTATAQIQVTPSGGAATRVAGQQTEAAAPVGREVGVVGVVINLKPGDAVSVIVNVDAGATGQVNGYGGLQGVEYDV